MPIRYEGPVGIVGLGVVGGTTEAAFMRAGIRVVGYDPHKGVGSTRELRECDLVFLCVPTPESGDGGLDPTAVWKAVEDIEPDLGTGTIVAVRSTVMPGTSDALAEAFPRLEFASVPEFLTADEPLETFTYPDRIVIGARNLVAFELLGDLMARATSSGRMAYVSPTEAEMIKLCSNAMLSAKVAMAVELDGICSAYGVDWNGIRVAVGADSRIGQSHLRVTKERGFGGACLPKDLAGLIAAGRAEHVETDLLESVLEYRV